MTRTPGEPEERGIRCVTLCTATTTAFSFFLVVCLSPPPPLPSSLFPWPLASFLFWYSDIHNYKLISFYVKSNRNMPLFIEKSSALHTYDICNFIHCLLSLLFSWSLSIAPTRCCPLPVPIPTLSPPSFFSLFRVCSSAGERRGWQPTGAAQKERTNGVSSEVGIDQSGRGSILAESENKGEIPKRQQGA